MNIFKMRYALFFTVYLLFLVGPSNTFSSPKDEPIVKAVQKTLPSVVNIYTEGVERYQIRDPRDIYFEQFFGRRYSRGNRIAEVPFRSLGSGLIVGQEGYIVTNFHVVERADRGRINITLPEGETYEAKLIRKDEDQDLALIQIIDEKRTDFPYLDLQKLSPNLLGQTVIAIGNPVGYESSVSSGILSAKDRTLNVGGATIEGLLQTDAAINPGNSGGPLIDIDGQLVGINTIKMGRDQNANVIDNIGFAIPAERVQIFVENAIAIAKGIKPAPPEDSLIDVLREKFGLSVQELSPSLADSFGFRPYEGLLINDVETNSQAANSGIEKGMIIVGLNGYPTREIAEIPRKAYKIRKGSQNKITLKFYRTYGRAYAQQIGTVMLVAN
ncbi:MAG: trypsin-like peptidase domain-containing protein [Verrucomicrobiota bacterium]